MSKGKTRLIGTASVFFWLLALVASSALAATTWQQTSGPTGGKIQALAVDPNNGQVVYAGTAAGVFKSTNGGAAWAPVITGIGPSRVSVLTVNPANSQIVYAGTAHGGVFKSTDGGSSWSALTITGTTGVVYSLAVLPGNVVFVGTPEGVFRSTDAGATWSEPLTRSFIPAPLPVYSVAADPSGATVYAASAFLLKSTDSGTTWTQVDTSGAAPLTVAIDPKNSLVVYLGTMHQGVYKSLDGGANWAPVNNGVPSDAVVEAIALDKNSSTVYIGTAYSGGTRTANGVQFPVSYSKIFRSLDGGLSWTDVNAGLTNTQVTLLPALDNSGPPIAVDPTDAQTVYTGTSDGVFKSTNGGNAWTPVSTGLIDTQVASVAIDRTSAAQTVYAGTASGLYKTTNGGAAWAPLHIGEAFPNVQSVALDPQNSQTVYAAGTDYNLVSWLAKSTDAGATWAEITDANAVTAGAASSSLVIDPSSTQIIYLARVGGSAGIFKSTDGGATWNPANSGLPSPAMVQSLAIDATSSQTLYAGIFEKGIFKTTTGGASWSAVNTGLPVDAATGNVPISVYALAVAPNNSQNLYAGTADQAITPVLYKSTNGGASWAPAGSVPSELPVQSLAIDARTGTVYAATMGRGVFQSTDAGATWTAINTGLFTLVQSLAVDPSGTGTLYAGTAGAGVYKSTTTAPGSRFGDVAADSIYASYIEAIASAGITQGCGGGNFCPAQDVTRGEMAAFIERALHGDSFSYTPTPYFTDVPADNTFFKYVQRLKDDGLTVTDGVYGVGGPVTRGQMAALLVRAKFGENFTFTPTPYFSDVPADNPYFKYVQKLKDTGITATTGTYNVDGNVTREQMAAFLSRAFLGRP